MHAIMRDAAHSSSSFQSPTAAFTSKSKPFVPMRYCTHLFRLVHWGLQQSRRKMISVFRDTKTAGTNNHFLQYIAITQFHGTHNEHCCPHGIIQAILWLFCQNYKLWSKWKATWLNLQKTYWSKSNHSMNTTVRNGKVIAEAISKQYINY